MNGTLAAEAAPRTVPWSAPPLRAEAAATRSPLPQELNSGATHSVLSARVSVCSLGGKKRRKGDPHCEEEKSCRGVASCAPTKGTWSMGDKKEPLACRASLWDRGPVFSSSHSNTAPLHSSFHLLLRNHRTGRPFPVSSRWLHFAVVQRVEIPRFPRTNGVHARCDSRSGREKATAVSSEQ